jgi:hypothetical protein
MILSLHITIAISSLISAGVVYFYPSKTRLKVSYILFALTLFTGFYLILSKPAHIAEVCVTGLVYLGFVSYSIVSARHTLAKVIE